MIVIYTDRDLRAESRKQATLDIGMMDIEVDLMLPASYAEDVYFWRNGEAKPLKRRNAPLIVPDWLEDRKDVDR